MGEGHVEWLTRQSRAMRREIEQGDRPTARRQRPACGQVPARGIVQSDLAANRHIRQQQPGEHLGDRTDLEQRVSASGAAHDDAAARLVDHAHNDGFARPLREAPVEQVADLGIGRQCPGT